MIPGFTLATLAAFGVFCVVVAIVGGDMPLPPFGKIPVLKPTRQMLLALVGVTCILTAAGFQFGSKWWQLRLAKTPEHQESSELSKPAPIQEPTIPSAPQRNLSVHQDKPKEVFSPPLHGRWLLKVEKDWVPGAIVTDSCHFAVVDILYLEAMNTDLVKLEYEHNIRFNSDFDCHKNAWDMTDYGYNHECRLTWSLKITQATEPREIAFHGTMIKSDCTQNNGISNRPPFATPSIEGTISTRPSSLILRPCFLDCDNSMVNILNLKPN